MAENPLLLAAFRPSQRVERMNMEKNLRSGVRLAALALWFLGVVAMQADRFFADFDDVQNDLGKFEAGQNQNPPPPAVTNDVQGGNSFIRMTWIPGTAGCSGVSRRTLIFG
jgi:hypothetical protein